MTRRGEILEQARSLTEGDRNKSYGSPEPNLHTFARLVGAYLDGRTISGRLNSVDGAVFMILLKVSRVAANQHHADNPLDMAAYSAILGECAEILEERKAGGQ